MLVLDLEERLANEGQTDEQGAMTDVEAEG
jgi:hypothetical protein